MTWAPGNALCTGNKLPNSTKLRPSCEVSSGELLYLILKYSNNDCSTNMFLRVFIVFK